MFPLLPVCGLLFAGALLPCLPACCHAPHHDSNESLTLCIINPSFFQLPWSCCFIKAVEKYPIQQPRVVVVGFIVLETSEPTTNWEIPHTQHWGFVWNSSTWRARVLVLLGHMHFIRLNYLNLLQFLWFLKWVRIFISCWCF